MERIKYAAIQYKILNEDPVTIVYGRSHADCIKWFHTVELLSNKRDMSFETQGFLTDTDRFVDRVEALKIAKAAGQVGSTYNRSELYSEFIEWDK